MVALPTPGVSTGWGASLNTFLTEALPTPILSYASVGGSSQTTNVQAAVDATPTGGTLDIPAGIQIRVDGQINITKAMTIRSSGRGGFYSGAGAGVAQKMFNVTSSDVHFRGVGIKGVQYTTQVANQTAINIVGASAAAPLQRVSVVDCDLNTWGQYGISAAYVTGFKFDDNAIRDINYAGIGMLSCISGTASGNRVSNIPGDFATTGNYNAYGIFTSRNYGTLVDEPRTSNVVIADNTIRDIPTWVGIDTHGGSMLTITGNNIRNTSQGISIVSSRTSVGGSSDIAPLDVAITGNTIDSTVTDGSRNSGIVVVANSAQKATGAITGNLIRGHGYNATDPSGGIQVEFTRGLVVSGNVLVECSPIGISFVSDNAGFSCEGNTINDVWSTSVTTKAISCSSVGGNIGYIGGNVLLSYTKTATKTSANGVGISLHASGTGSAVRTGINVMSVASIPLSDTANFSVSSVTGSRGGNAALATLLSVLAAKGMIVDSTTA